jgi:hypothetical protein
MEGLITTLVSIWTWTVLVACLVIWLPIMTLMRVVLAPFDRGRYWTGLFFRKVAVVTATLNPYWRFRTAGNKVLDPRRPYVAGLQSRVLCRYPPDQSSALGDEVAFQG